MPPWRHTTSVRRYDGRCDALLRLHGAYEPHGGAGGTAGRHRPLRRGGAGAKWHRPIDVYRSKVYELPEEEESLACRMGHFLEPLVADLFTEETGYRVHRWNRMLTSSEYPWAFANIDRKLRGYDRGLECKTCSVYRERQFDDEMFPPEYYVQIQHYLAVTGWDTWYLAALIGNKRFVWYTVPRNDEDIKEIMEREEAFWQIIIDKNEEEAEQWL